MLEIKKSEPQSADPWGKDEALIFSNPFVDQQLKLRETTFEWALNRSAELACFVGDTLVSGCRQIAERVSKFDK